MKNRAWVLLLVVAGCRNEPILVINPGQLTGTWRSVSPAGQLTPVWTFDNTYLYMGGDSSAICRPAQAQPNQYWIEKDVLVTRYAGITNGLIPIPDVRMPIQALTATQLMVDLPAGQRQTFNKCL